MIEELYINGVLADIENVQIQRKYTTPFFSDVTQIKNDGSYTVKLPDTEINKSIFQYINRVDSSTSIQYTKFKADYYCDGMPIFLQADAILLSSIGSFEVQFTWGVVKENLSDMFTEKMNEIIPDVESDWIVKWDNIQMFANNKKYRYIDYIGRERVSDVVIENGVILPKVEVPDFFADHQKTMAWHPFVSFSDLIDLAVSKYSKDVILITYDNPAQDVITFNTGGIDISTILNIGDVLEELDGNMIGFTATIISFADMYSVQFSGNITEFYQDGVYAKIRNIRDCIEKDILKDRLSEKGILLGSNNDNQDFSIDFETKLAYGDSYGIPFTDTGLIKSCLSFGTSIDNNFTYTGVDIPLSVTLDLEMEEPYSNFGLGLYSGKFNANTSQWEYTLIKLYQKSQLQNLNYKITGTIDYTLPSCEYEHLFIRFTSGSFYDFQVAQGGKIIVKFKVNKGLYSTVGNTDIPAYDYGRYNTIYNLPNITRINFIKQLGILSGVSFGYNKYGDMKSYTLEKLKENLDAGIIYDWSNRVSDIRKSSFRFNGNSKHNYIKYKNNDDLSYDSKADIIVNDDTISDIRELFNVEFDIPEKDSNGKAEFIIYKQKVEQSEENGVNVVSFNNELDEKESVVVCNQNDIATIQGVLPTNSGVFGNTGGLGNISGSISGTKFIKCAILGLSVDKKTVTIDSSIIASISVGDSVCFTSKDISNKQTATILQGVTVLSKDSVLHKITLSHAIQTGDLFIYITDRSFSNTITIDYSDVAGYTPEIGDSLDRVINHEYYELYFSDVKVTSFNKQTGVIIFDNSVFISGTEATINIIKYGYGFVDRYYSIYKKLIERPIVIECDVDLSMYESSNIDFEKPVYIQEIGRYCLLLELNAGNKNELCDAKLLLINQKL